MSDWFSQNAPQPVQGSGDWFRANAPDDHTLAAAEAEAQAQEVMRATGAGLQANVTRRVPNALRGYTAEELNRATATPNPLTPIQRVSVRDQIQNPYHAGLTSIAEGVAQMSSPTVNDAAEGAHKIISGGLQTISTPALAAGALAAPVPTVVGLVAGSLAQKTAEAAAKKLGAPEGVEHLAGDVAGLIGGHYGAKGYGAAKQAVEDFGFPFMMQQENPGVIPRAVDAVASLPANVLDATQRVGARVVANAPEAAGRVAGAVSKGAKAIAPDLTKAAAATVVPVLGKPIGVGLLLKSAYKLHQEGIYGDVATAFADLVRKKTLAELQAANAQRQAVWEKYPDIAAEMDAEAAPAEATEPDTPAALPSGRTPGGIQNQVNEAPAPAPPRRAPLWQQLPASETPAPVAPAEAPAPVALPSGRKPGGIQNQSAEAAPVEAAPAAPATPAPAASPTEPAAPAALSPEAAEALAHAREHDHPSVIEHIHTTGQAPAPGILRVLQHGDNKAGVFARYIQEQAIDPARVQQVETSTALVDQFKQQAELPGKASVKQIRAAAEKHGRLDIVDAVEQVQGFADEAHAFATANEMPAGKEYQLISPGTWALVRKRFGATPGEPYMGAAAKLVPPAPATPARRLLASEPEPAVEAAPEPTKIDTRSGAQKEADAILANAKAEAARIVAEARQSVTPAGNSQTPATLPAWEDEQTLRADARGNGSESGALSGSDRTSQTEAGRRGAETLVRIPGTSRVYKARYDIAELDDLQPSHSGLTFEPNPGFGLENQRNYKTAANQGKIVEWSTPEGFDPEYLVTDAPDALNGPPVTDSEDNGLAGNGRLGILQRVYAHNPKGAAAYRALIERKAAQFGVDPAKVRGAAKPVLRRIVDDAEFEPGSGKTKGGAIADFNVRGTAELTPAERAISDSRRVSERTLADVAGRLEAKGSDATLADILDGKSGLDVLAHLVDDGVIASQEQAAYAGKEALTKAGKERVSQLMLGRFFHDPAHLDNIAPAIRNKVERLAAPLAQVEGLGDAWNLTPHVQDALALLDRMRESGSKNLADFLRQDGLFGSEKHTPAATHLAGALLEKTQRQLTDAARAYAEDAQFATKGESLFGNPPTPAEAFEAAFGKPEATPEPAPVKKQSGAEKQAAEVMAKAKAGKTSAPTTPTKSAQAIAEAPAKADNAAMPGEYPKAGAKVDGLTVREDVPNMGSIASTLDNYEVLPGIREVPMSAFEAPNTFYSASDHARVNQLAREIAESGELNPLIVVMDEKGAYVLEGGHRLAALDKLKKKSLPAKVVIDRDAVPEPEPPKPAEAFEAAFGKPEATPEPAPVKKQSGAEKQAAEVMAKAKAGKTSAPTTPTKSAQAIAEAPAKADNQAMAPASSQPAQKVIADLNDKYASNPGNPKERIFLVKGKKAGDFEVVERDGRLRIKSIQADEPGNGVGSLLLSRILKIADQHGVTVELTASPKGSQFLSGEALKSWYKKHGFVDEPGHDTALGYLIRKPKTDRARGLKDLGQ